MFATPRTVSLEECLFYHSMVLPGMGRIPGLCSLEATLPYRVNHLNLTGKRVLEVGPATGFFTFAMEQAGADVVACELSSRDKWDSVPGASDGTFRPKLEQVKNSFWFCHAALESRAKVVESTVYDLPLSLGTFDVVCVHDVLTHLRDPFRALTHLANFATETLVVSEIEPFGASIRRSPLRWLARRYPLCVFMPRPGDSNNHTWWQLSSEACDAMLNRLGFITSCSFYRMPVINHRIPAYTVTGTRSVAR